MMIEKDKKNKMLIEIEISTDESRDDEEECRI